MTLNYYNAFGNPQQTFYIFPYKFYAYIEAVYNEITLITK